MMWKGSETSRPAWARVVAEQQEVRDLLVPITTAPECGHDDVSSFGVVPNDGFDLANLFGVGDRCASEFADNRSHGTYLELRFTSRGLRRTPNLPKQKSFAHGVFRKI